MPVLDEREERKQKEREGEFCVCLEVGSRKDIVTDMNIESIWQRQKLFITYHHTFCSPIDVLFSSN